MVFSLLSSSLSRDSVSSRARVSRPSILPSSLWENEVFGSTVSIHYEDDNVADFRRERKIKSFSKLLF